MGSKYTHMRKKYTDQDIIEMYIVHRKTYKEIQQETGMHCVQIAKIVRGLKSRSEASKERAKRWNESASDSDRQKRSDKMSEVGKVACRQSKKCWTKPEREFFEILKEINVLVIFPEFMIDLFGIKNETLCLSPCATLYCQYPLQRYVVDFADVENKLVFAVNGDFWHANPILYFDKKLTDIQRHNIKADKLREDYLSSKGWTTHVIWESEIKWNKKLVVERIKEIYSGAERKLVTPSDLHSDSAGFDPQFAHQSWEERLKKLWFKEPRKKAVLQNQICKTCLAPFYFPATKRGRKYCSPDCVSFGQRRATRPELDVLAKEVAEFGYLAVSRRYGVSDNAIRKWLSKEDKR